MATDWNTTTLYGHPAYGSKIDKAISGLAKPVMGILSTVPVALTGSPHALWLITAPMLIGTGIRERSYNKKLTEDFKTAFGGKHKELYIDKNPSHKTTPTKPEHLAAAMGLRIIYKRAVMENVISLTIYSLAFGLGRAYSSYSADSPAPYDPTAKPEVAEFIANNPELTITGAIGLGASIIAGVSYLLTDVLKNIETTYRFHKIVKGDWVITDSPPPEQVTEPLADKAKRAFGVLVPPAPEPTTAKVTAPQITQMAKPNF